MKFALYGLHRGSSVNPSTLISRSRRAEEAGFEALWVGDHVALPATAPDPAHEPRLEALTALTFIAAATQTVRLGVGVLVLPQRQPVLLAKQLASLDVLSGGRLTVGVGVGYVEAELGAFGVRLADRAAVTDEYLEALRILWRGEPQEFVGRWVSFSDVIQSPIPTQHPSPPIVIGGHVAASFRRAATTGDGWFGWSLGVDEAASAIASLRHECEQAGRDPEELEITIAPTAPPSPREVSRYAAVGVHRLVLQPADFTGSTIDELIETAASTLIGRIDPPG